MYKEDDSSADFDVHDYESEPSYSEPAPKPSRVRNPPSRYTSSNDDLAQRPRMRNVPSRTTLSNDSAQKPRMRNVPSKLGLSEDARTSSYDESAKPKKGSRLGLSEDPSSKNTPPPCDPQKTRQELRCMWELASILNFLNVFRSVLNLDTDFRADELESALLDPVPSELLKDLHIGLLKGIPPNPRQLDRSTWLTELTKKLKNYWVHNAEGECPFKPPKGFEDAAYEKLTPHDRVLVLKSLCEMRLEDDNIRGAMEHTIKRGDPPSSFQLESCGADSQGGIYWYEDDAFVGSRMYCEQRGGAKSRATGKRALPPCAGSWETVCTSLEEFQEFGDTFAASRNRKEAQLGRFILHDIIPELEEREKKKERAVKRQQRAAAQLEASMSILSERPRRERRAVKYTFEDYDRSIKDAIRTTQKGAKEELLPVLPSGRSSRQQNGRNMPEEQPTRRSERGRPGLFDPPQNESDNNTTEDEGGPLPRSLRVRKTTTLKPDSENGAEAKGNDWGADEVLGEVEYEEDYAERDNESEKEPSERPPSKDDDYRAEESEQELDDDFEISDEEGDSDSRGRRPKRPQKSLPPERPGTRKSARNQERLEGTRKSTRQRTTTQRSEEYVEGDEIESSEEEEGKRKSKRSRATPQKEDGARRSARQRSTTQKNDEEEDSDEQQGYEKQGYENGKVEREGSEYEAEEHEESEYGVIDRTGADEMDEGEEEELLGGFQEKKEVLFDLNEPQSEGEGPESSDDEGPYS